MNRVENAQLMTTKDVLKGKEEEVVEAHARSRQLLLFLDFSCNSLTVMKGAEGLRPRYHRPESLGA